MATAQPADQVFVPSWTFADKIRKARTIAGMEQRAFAEAVGLTASTVAAYETGRSTPRFRDVRALAMRIQLLTRIDYRWFLDAGEEYAPRDLNPEPTDYRTHRPSNVTGARDEARDAMHGGAVIHLAAFAEARAARAAI